MKNVKFGVFGLGLLVAVATAISSLSAQGGQAERGRRLEQVRPEVMVLDGRGAQLGVMVSDLDPSTSLGASASTGTGVRIDEVNPDSPAEKAGIRAGDVVVEFDGERVRSARQFTRLVQETPEGREVAIALMRDGKRQTVNATPESGRVTWDFGPDVDRALREAERGMRGFRFETPRQWEFRGDGREPRRFEYRLPDRVMPFINPSRGRLGVTVQSLTDDLQEYFGATNGGALVSSVTAESAASKAGIKAGDVIVSVNGRTVRDSDDLLRELEDITGDATIVVLRDKKEVMLKATIEPSGRRTVRPSVRG